MLALIILSIVVFGVIIVLTAPKKDNPFNPGMTNEYGKDYESHHVLTNLITLAFYKQSSGNCRKHSNKLRYSHNAKIKRRKK